MPAAASFLHFRGLLVFLTLTTIIWFLYLCFTFSDVVLGTRKEYVTTTGNIEMDEAEGNHVLLFQAPENTVAFEQYDSAVGELSVGEGLDVVKAATDTTELEKTVDKVIEGSKFRSRWKQRSPYIDRKYHLNTTGEMKNKTILWWNPPSWLKNWFADFDMNQCEYKNCRVSFSQKHFLKSDAVVYSLVDDGMGNRPPIPRQMRNPNQAWIFFTLESPIHVKMSKRPFMNPDWQNVFNWSWTYRTDADIFHPYGTLVTKEIIPKKDYSEIFRKKTKLAAWAVSHCRTYSRREKYESLLNKYAKVDIYGGCGLKPPPDLKKFINTNYKFYLGFENSFCDEYMTEKFFNYYKMDVITIVRGKGDYNKFLPKGSFINAADFPSVKSLAKFMHELASNEEEYIKYLKVKDRYKVYERDFMYRDASCNICEKLNNLEKNRKTYKSVSDWLGSCYTINDLKEYK